MFRFEEKCLVGLSIGVVRIWLRCKSHEDQHHTQTLLIFFYWRPTALQTWWSGAFEKVWALHDSTWKSVLLTGSVSRIRRQSLIFFDELKGKRRWNFWYFVLSSKRNAMLTFSVFLQRYWFGPTWIGKDCSSSPWTCSSVSQTSSRSATWQTPPRWRQHCSGAPDCMPGGQNPILFSLIPIFNIKCKTTAAISIISVRPSSYVITYNHV